MSYKMDSKNKDIVAFCNISWNLKSKFILLKKIIDSKNSQDLCEYEDDIAWGLINGLKINHLVPHSSNVYKIMKNQMPNLVLAVNKNLKQLLSVKDLSVVQINFFKYFLPDQNLDLLEDLLKMFVQLQTSDVPEFVFLKILQTLYRCNRDVQFSLASTEIILKNSLKHQNATIRLAALELICNKLLTAGNFQIIEHFLIENIYVEHAPFRNELIKTYTNFVLKIQELLYKYIRRKTDLNANIRDQILNHFEWLAFFVQNSLKINSYQRNKFSLMLFEFILNYFQTENEEILRKNGVLNKNFCIQKLACVKIYLENENKWKFNETKLQELLIDKTKDENSDISEKSVELLIKYFSNSTEMDYQKLYVDSSEYLLSATEFYNIEASVNTFQVAVRCYEPLWLNIDEILFKYINFAEIYHLDLVNDFRSTIMNSNEMYAYLLIFKTFCDQLMLVQIERIFEVITKLIEFLLNIFYVDKSVEDNGQQVVLAPSFAEMSHALNRILNIEQIEDCMLTDDEQILLNRIWLNIKVSCDLLVIIGSNSSSISYQSRCLKILVNILQSNRHKGVIEAAGNSLSNLVTYLTSNNGCEHVIDSVIQSILHSLTNEASRSSCTRRTAGLSILVYRIALGDRRKEKPLLRIILDTLTDVAKKWKNDTAENVTVDRDLKDNGLVVALHCLKPLVHDSCLWLKTQDYLMDLFEICFSNMTTEKNWNIRNASLQLYGALICKMIGQNKDISIEDIDTKYPLLLDYIITIIDNKSDQNLFPILEFLSQTFVITFETDQTRSIWFKINRIKSYILPKTTNSNYYIRNLAAKTYTNLTPLVLIREELLKFIQKLNSSNLNVNAVHGYILVISHLAEKIKNNCQNEDFSDLKLDVNKLLEKINKLPAFVTYPLIKSFPQSIFRSSAIVNNIGDKELTRLKYTDILDINDKINILLHYQFQNNLYEFEEILATLVQLFNRNQLKFVSLNIWNQLLNKLFSIYFLVNDENIKLLMANFITSIVISIENVTIPRYSVNIQTKKIIINTQSVHSLAMKSCFFDQSIENDEFLKILLKDLKQKYQPFIDEDLRVDAATTLVVLFKNYSKIPKNILFDLLFINYWLLLDEEPQVRDIASIFVSNLRNILFANTSPVEHAYCSTFTFLQDCLSLILTPNEEAKFLMNCIIMCHTLPAKQIKSNPFAHHFIVNKLEDAYLLKQLYDRFVILLQKLTAEEIECLKKYFLQYYLNLQIEINGVKNVTKLKIDYIRNVKSLFI